MYSLPWTYAPTETAINIIIWILCCELNHYYYHEDINSLHLLLGVLPTNSVRHYADAERILQDVQQRREHLDRNLEAVIRQREEQDLYNLVDSMAPLTG